MAGYPLTIRIAMEAHVPEKLFQQMEKPDFYPHPARSVDVRETHISKVFLVGDVVYKIKKPLNLGFLDFTTLEKRKYFCHREVVLNRRLAADIYLDVVSICLENGAYRLGGPGRVVEYAVKMRRLPEAASMARLLDENRIHEKEISALAHVLAAFYDRPEADSAAEDDPPADGFGTWKAVRDNCRENFTQTAGFAGTLFDEGLFKIVRAAVMAFLQRRKSLFEKRVRSGKIRDCHGDLRTDHIYFIDDGIRIIDCIEFNKRFRYEDVVSDLAFLAMDLDARGHGHIARPLLTEYVRRTRDADLFVLIDFYKSYRAMVRFKVGCIRVNEADVSETEKTRLLSEIKNYLNLAYEYAVGFTRPVIWVVCGMPASGKSTIAEKLSRTFDILIFQADVIRKQHFASVSADLSHLGFEQGIYSKGVTALTYGRLLLLAQETLENGNSVVLDATFSARHFRKEALRLAAEMDATIFFVECTAPEEVLKTRLIRRESQGGVSDARIKHFDAFRNGFEPLDEIRPDQRIVVHTQKSIDECLGRILYNEYIAPPADTDVSGGQ
jgi:uncharacterized protein